MVTYTDTNTDKDLSPGPSKLLVMRVTNEHAAEKQITLKDGLTTDPVIITINAPKGSDQVIPLDDGVRFGKKIRVEGPDAKLRFGAVYEAITVDVASITILPITGLNGQRMRVTISGPVHLFRRGSVVKIGNGKDVRVIGGIPSFNGCD